MSPLRTSLLALVALIAALPACTAEPGDSDASEDDLRIKPKDGENLSRLTVTTPAGWTLPVNPADDARVVYRDSQVPLNAEQRLKEGDGAIHVLSKFDVQSIHAGNVTLVKGAASTFELGSIKPTFTPASDAGSTLQRDFGPTPVLKAFYTAPGLAEKQVFGQSNSYSAFWNGKPQRAILAPPGAYRFSWSLPILADLQWTLGGGDNATIDLNPADQRATIIVKKPAVRDLPDVPVQRCHAAAQSFVVHRRVDNSHLGYGEPTSGDQRNTAATPPVNTRIHHGFTDSSSNEGVVSWAALFMKDDTTIRVFPFAASEGANHYEVVVSNVATSLPLKPGETKTVQLERLDVDDVEVTKENGGTYMVKGTWKLFRQQANGSWAPMTVRQDCSNGAGQQISHPTGTGIDVLPGTYRILISYSTAEGQKTQDHTVTVP